MANTAIASMQGRFIEITFAGSGASWDFTTDTKIPAEIRALGYLHVKSITFEPSQAGDICIITEGPGSGGPAIFLSKTIETTSGVIPTDRWTYDEKSQMRPYFDLTRSTLNTPSAAKILIETV